jgi:hypothetical protein
LLTKFFKSPFFLHSFVFNYFIVLAGKGLGPLIQFQRGCKGAWSIKSVFALLERGVVNKVSFSMAKKGRDQ